MTTAPEGPGASAEMGGGHVIVGGGFEAATFAVAESLPGSGSSMPDCTVAVFAIAAPFARLQSRFPTQVRVAEASRAREATWQVRVPVPPTGGVAQDQSAGAETDWKVVPAGRVSETTTSSAASGPALATPSA